MNRINYPFQDYHLPVEVRVNDLISKLTLDEKVSLMPTRQSPIERLGIKSYSVGGEAAHGVVNRDGDAATVFPQPIGLACTWNPDLMYQIGSTIGDEARAYYKKAGEKGGLTRWAPTVDMERDPRWGRTEEAYGEDPHLTGQMTTALVKGMQGDDPFYIKMVATLKHFYANNNEEDRLKSSSSIDPRNMREYYWNAFKPAIVDGGAYSIMTAYNSINGIPAILHPDINNVVKKQWGLRGFVVCDGADMHQTVDDHQYYENYAEAVAGAIKSGIDCITDDPELVKESIYEAISLGLLTEEDLDHALKNVFRIRFQLGQFDPDTLNPYASISETVICSPENNALSRKAAQESIVLLKNEQNTLPLNKNGINKVAVIGLLADEVYTDWYTGALPYQITPLEGIKKKLPKKTVLFKEGADQITLRSLLNHQYLYVDCKEGNPVIAGKSEEDSIELFNLIDWGWGKYTLKSQKNNKYITTEDEAICATSEEVKGWFVKELYNFIPQGNNSYTIRTWDGKAVCVSEDGKGLLISKEVDIVTDAERFKKDIVIHGVKEAIEVAKESDVAIVFVGNCPYVNGKEEIDRPDIILAPAQEELIKSVYNANPNTVVVVVGSYPIAINWAEEHIPAILYTSHGGQELGNAIADVLFGDYSPAGRLNMTWYRSVEQLPDIMDYDIIKGNRTYMYFEGEALYPFGHGLTYSSFRYSDLKLSTERLKEENEVKITVQVKNTGIRSSDEVVQLYVRDDQARVKRPLKELKGFQRIHLDPEEVQKVEFTLKASELAFWDVTREKFCVESGTYTIMVGKSSEDIQLMKVLEVEGEHIPHRDLSKATRAENYDDYENVLLDECKEGGTCVSTREVEAWICFQDVLLEKELYSFEARVSNVHIGGAIEIRLNHPLGMLIGSCNMPNTSGKQSWATVGCEIARTAGVHSIYLKLKGKISVSWFRFISLYIL